LQNQIAYDWVPVSLSAKAETKKIAFSFANFINSDDAQFAKILDISTFAIAKGYLWVGFTRWHLFVCQ
jgi:hypothetical protein